MSRPPHSRWCHLRHSSVVWSGVPHSSPPASSAYPFHLQWPLRSQHHTPGWSTEPTGSSEPPDCVSGAFIRHWPAVAEPARWTKLIRTSKSFILLALLCSLVQGCVGYTVHTVKTQTYQDPVVCEPPNPGAVQARTGLYHDRAPCTADWLEAHWGKPQAIVRPASRAGGSDEIWKYRFKEVWTGIVPWVIVPIPLMLPLEGEEVRFVVRNGTVVSARRTMRRSQGWLAGYVPGPSGSGFEARSVDTLPSR
jgi:hypothetical protein